MSSNVSKLEGAFRRGARLLTHLYASSPSPTSDPVGKLAFVLETSRRALDGYLEGRFSLARNPGVVDRLTRLLVSTSYAPRIDARVSHKLHEAARSLAGGRFDQVRVDAYREQLTDARETSSSGAMCSRRVRTSHPFSRKIDRRCSLRSTTRVDWEAWCVSRSSPSLPPTTPTSTR